VTKSAMSTAGTTARTFVNRSKVGAYGSARTNKIAPARNPSRTNVHRLPRGRIDADSTSDLIPKRIAPNAVIAARHHESRQGATRGVAP